MEFESNWKSKTLENLEKDHWEKPKEESHTVTRCHNLRKIPLDQFSIEDLRIMIGQGIGLKYLLPLAIEELKKNILAEGDLFEGDLLEALRRVNSELWNKHPEYKKELNKLIAHNSEILEHNGINSSLIDD